MVLAYAQYLCSLVEIDCTIWIKLVNTCLDAVKNMCSFLWFYPVINVLDVPNFHDNLDCRRRDSIMYEYDRMERLGIAKRKCVTRLNDGKKYTWSIPESRIYLKLCIEHINIIRKKWHQFPTKSTTIQRPDTCS